MFQVLTQTVPALRPRVRVLTTLMSLAKIPHAKPQSLSLARSRTCTEPTRSTMLRLSQSMSHSYMGEWGT